MADEPSDVSSLPRMLLMAGLPFGAVMGLVIGFIHTPGLGVAAGVFGGVLFAMGMREFMVKMAASRTPPALAPGEEMVKVGGANHVVGAESVGGTLYLTSRVLHFESHGMNVRDHSLRIPLSAVSRVEKARTLGIVPNGLLITHGDGARERFVVNGRGAWADAITRAIRFG